MESRIQQFLLNNAPLSGFTTSMTLNSTSSLSQTVTATLPSTQTPLRPMRSISPIPQRYRPSSPRPTSPLLLRPISPLAMESTSAPSDSAGSIFLKSISNISSSTAQQQNFYCNESQVGGGVVSLASGISSNNLAISPGSSFVYGTFFICLVF